MPRFRPCLDTSAVFALTSVVGLALVVAAPAVAQQAVPADPVTADEPPPVMLDEIVFDWIAVNRKPEDVFSREALVAWAHDNGFCTKEEVVKAIVENLLPRKL